MTAGVHAERPLRLIQVGAGGMGRVWLALLRDSPDVELVGLVDLDRSLAEAALDELGFDAASVAVARSVTELAGSTRADAVVNVTVPAAHHPVTTEALLSGLHVLTEKPIAPTIREALSLAAASEASDRLLMTSQSRRYYATLAEFRAQVRSLGRLGLASTDLFVAPRFGGFRDEMPHPLLVDMAIHQFDTARYVLDADPLSVYCESSNPSWSWYAGDAAATAVFEFEGGIRWVFDGSWCSDGLETSWNGSWRVNGEHGTAAWDGETAPTAERADGASTDTGATDAGAMEAADDSALGAPPAGETIAGALAEFVDALRTGRAPWGEVHSNVLSLAMVEAAVASAESSVRVSIDEVLEAGYAQALEDEARPDVRRRLAGWGSARNGLGTTPRWSSSSPQGGTAQVRAGG